MRCGLEALEDATTVDGRKITRYRLFAGAIGLEVINVGCAITRLEAPDRWGRPGNVVLGHADLRRYAGENRDYFGSVVGRVANRIANARFSLDGVEHRLEANNGTHHLHGGRRGFDQHSWQVIEARSVDSPMLAFALTSLDGDEGYPGRLRAQVRYTLTAEGELRLEYTAESDAATLVNLTNHSYFNLSGDPSRLVLQQELQIEADEFCAVDDTLIPTGELRPVEGTPFDFRRPATIGQRIGDADGQLQAAGGYDHCFVLRGERGRMRHACTLVDPSSGRRMQVATDQPGVQFYSGNFLDGSVPGPNGNHFARHAGLCLETQAWPDAPHHGHFPSIELRPGQRYRAATTLRFDVLP